MRITRVAITNYKGLKLTDVPLSTFTTLIGENNTGKSSLLQALLLFVKGTKLDSASFFDPSQDITIEVSLDEVTSAALSALAEEHRGKIEELVINEKLRLMRRYKTDGTSALRVIMNVPIEERFSADFIKELLKGKKGKDVETTAAEQYPEIKDKLNGVTTQKAALALIGELADQVLPEQRHDVDVDLPTGFDNSIKAVLPEPVYIPAVKDLQDDIKTKESTSFGKLLSILLNVIDPQLAEARETFAVLERQLNRVTDEEGNPVDERLEEVKEIERTVEGFVQESFAEIRLELQIPPPEIKTVLSNARIMADDGVLGEVDTKGDGLKRAITFAILRSYVELSRKPEWQVKRSQVSADMRGRYLFLFEEPELYLHPKAQKSLFDALGQISVEHQVVLSTHSPLFFGPDSTGTFIKMVKRDDAVKPRGHALPVDLGNMTAKEQFQLICYDNNNAAFFADGVLLVEGDSDYLVVPHLSKTLSAEWDFGRGRIAVVRIHGKGSIRRYREFFQQFDMRVMVFTDLDILVNDFDKLDVPDDLNRLRSTLLQRVDRAIADAGEAPTMNSAQAREAQRSGRQKQLWEAARAKQQEHAEGKAPVEELNAAIDEFFAVERKPARMARLASADGEIADQKNSLLRRLREHDIFVLEKGEIEDYYPDSVTGGDKPSKAQSFCREITTDVQAESLCNTVVVDNAGNRRPEFRAIFESIFGDGQVGPARLADEQGKRS